MQMNSGLKLYHKLLSILTILICLFVFINFGWSAYSTITESSGLNGSMYLYYGLSRLQFSVYTIVVAIVGIIFIYFLTVYLIRKTSKMITKTLWFFVSFIGLLAICEILLQIRFIGKG